MQNVTLIDLAYPCALYALKRTGATITVPQLLEMKYQEFVNLSSLTVGDILVWRADADRYEEVVLNMGNKGPITAKVSKCFHYGVYEGEDYISDMVINEYTHIPHIRMKRFRSSNKPHGVISKHLL